MADSIDFIDALDKLHDTQHSYAAIRDLLHQAADSSEDDGRLDSVGASNLLSLFGMVYDSMDVAIKELERAHKLGQFKVVG